MLKVVFERGSGSRDPIPTLLQNWSWLGRVERHPVRIKNCRKSAVHPQPASGGNLQVGFRRNAASVCRTCYPGSSGAILSWGIGKGSLVINDPNYETPLKWAVIHNVENESTSKPTQLVEILDELGLGYEIKKLVRA